MKATIRLNNSILGWMLVPSYSHPSPEGGVESILSRLYGEDWMKMKSSDRAFLKGEPVEAAMAHIKEVCKDMGIKVSFCGNLKCPVIRLWWNPVVAVEPEKVSVDLKWACWSEDRGHWDEYAPGIFAKLEGAFKGTGGPITVVSCPRKEIRYGSVTVSKGKASGVFSTEWDSLEELADTLGTECDEAFNEMIPYSVQTMEPGMDWEFSVKARTFASLMRKIDREESDLIARDKEEWGFIESCFRKKS